jgi:multiple sugar transport system permease protein
MLSADYGIVWTYLVKWGIISSDFSFFSNPRAAMFAVIVANVWRGFPFVAVMSYAKLKTIPTEQIEAAMLDGTNAIQRFFNVVLPWIFPILKRCSFLVFVWNFNSFSIIYSMTKGGPGATTETFPIMIQRIAFRMLDFGQAATLGTFSALIVIAVLIIVTCTGHIINTRRVQHI